jgi:hypothetical protein
MIPQQLAGTAAVLPAEPAPARQGQDPPRGH